MRAEMERLAADASEDEWNAELHRAMHESHLQSVRGLNDENRGPSGDGK